MVRLSVNVNKLALIRNSRGKNQPDVLSICEDLLQWGAHGITVHPRPDGRHIRHQDVQDLAKLIQLHRTKANVELNVEGFPSDEFLNLIELTRPQQCTLVPDPPDALTSSFGWNFPESRRLLDGVIAQIQNWNVRVSLFIDPANCNPLTQTHLEELRPNAIEMFTEAYAQRFDVGLAPTELHQLSQTSRWAAQAGFRVHAGHDLNLGNLPELLNQCPEVCEVSIGHAFVCDSLSMGLKNTLSAYLNIVSRMDPHPAR